MRKARLIKCQNEVPCAWTERDPSLYDSTEEYNEGPAVRLCGAMATETTHRYREIPDGSRGHLVREVSCPVCDAPPPPKGTCDGCGAAGDFYDGLCYPCQCDAHADGSYDMDA